MRTLVLQLAVICLPVFAQDQGIQLQLIQRQQQSDAFSLQLRQSQERLGASPANLRRQQEFDARQTAERQRLDNVSSRQLVDVKPDTPQEMRSYERQNADDERRPLTFPAKEIPLRTGDGPRPLPGAQRGVVQVIETPREDGRDSR